MELREIGALRAAAVLNDQIMQKLARYLKEGMTEKEAAAYAADQYAKAGGETAFPPAVSFGVHTADPYHVPDDTRLMDGDAVIVGLSCRKDGVSAAMSRTFCCGKAGEPFLKVHDAVRRAGEVAEMLVRPGAKLNALEEAVFTVLTEAGYEGSAPGQSVCPLGEESAEDTLAAGMVLSVGPAVYLPEQFGIHTQDLVLVTEAGCEVLNLVDKHCRNVG